MAEDRADRRAWQRERTKRANLGRLKPDDDGPKQLGTPDQKHDLPVEAVAFKHFQLDFENLLLPAEDLDR